MICSSEATRIMPVILLNASVSIFPSRSTRPLSPSILRRFSRYTRTIGITSHLRHREVRCVIFLLVLLRRYHGGNYRYSIAALLDDSFKTHSLVSSLGHVLYELGIPVGIISFFLSKEITQWRS